MSAFSQRFCLALLLFFSSSLFPQRFVHGDANFVEQTCKQTMAPMLCETCLVPDPRIESANLKGLIKILAGCATNQAVFTWKYLQMVARHTSDPHLSEAISCCLPQFYPVSQHLINGCTLIYNDSYEMAKEEVRIAESLAFVCLDKFRQYPMLTVPYRVLAAMLEFQGLCQIVNALICKL